MSRPRPKVVWGTCWFDEEPQDILRSLAAIRSALRTLGVDVVQVVFDARHDRDRAARAWIRAHLACEIVSTHVDAYPNKNLGVAKIATIAERAGADFVAIVDADWAFDSIASFVDGLLSPLLRREADAALPDITAWAGRANRLVGEPAMDLLCPGMRAAIPTPFPGAVAASPRLLAAIVSAPGYHYDWGGEWDIAAGLWRSGSAVASVSLGMVNVRHRPTASKAGDGFQIWRATLADGVPTHTVPNPDSVRHAAAGFGMHGLMELLRGSATQQLEGFTHAALPEDPLDRATVAQLVPMVLAPLALLLDGTDTLALRFPETDTDQPYRREALPALSVVATAAAAAAFAARDAQGSPPTLSGGPMGTWTADSSERARREVASLPGPIE